MVDRNINSTYHMIKVGEFYVEFKTKVALEALTGEYTSAKLYQVRPSQKYYLRPDKAGLTGNGRLVLP